MNPAYAKATATEAGLRVEANEIASGSHQQVDQFIAQTYGEYERFRQQCIDEIASIANKTPHDKRQNEDYAYLVNESLPSLRTAGAEEVIEHREAARSKLYDGDRRVLAVLTHEGLRDVGLETLGIALSGVAKAALVDRRSAMAGVADELQVEIEKWRVDCREQVKIALRSAETPDRGDIAAQDAKGAQAKERVEQAKLTVITGSGVLLNDRMEAFFVTAAGEEYWARRYNRAFGNGFFGSTSVAIKMNDTADFTVKGFVFDGRSTAEMVRKVGVQSVALIAASFGAPINLGKPAGSTSTSPTYFDNSDQVSDLQTAAVTAQAQEGAFRAGLFRVADSVIANWVSLVEQGNTMSRDIVAGTFNAYKDAWKPSGGQASPPKP
jgi:hypothetical protein